MTDTPKPKNKAIIIFAAVLVGLVVIFMLLNMEVIEVNLIVAKVSIRRSFMIVSVLVIGFVSGWLAKSATTRRHSPA